MASHKQVAENREPLSEERLLEAKELLAWSASLDFEVTLWEEWEGEGVSATRNEKNPSARNESG